MERLAPLIELALLLLRQDPFEEEEGSDDRDDAHREGAPPERTAEGFAPFHPGGQDPGRVPETAARYDSDRAVTLNELQKSPDRIKTLEAHIALMKKWAAEGK